MTAKYVHAAETLRW